MPLPRGLQATMWLWTRRQRAAMGVVLVLLLAYLAVRLWINPTYVSDPQPLSPPQAAELADRIDPNSADWVTLSALPQLGEKRAKLIVEYRDRMRALHPNEVVYQEPNDLLRIRGIGAATLEQIKPFLIFTANRAANTQPLAR